MKRRHITIDNMMREYLNQLCATFFVMGYFLTSAAIITFAVSDAPNFYKDIADTKISALWAFAAIPPRHAGMDLMLNRMFAQPLIDFIFIAGISNVSIGAFTAFNITSRPNRYASLAHAVEDSREIYTIIFCYVFARFACCVPLADFLDRQIFIVWMIRSCSLLQPLYESLASFWIIQIFTRWAAQFYIRFAQSIIDGPNADTIFLGQTGSRFTLPISGNYVIDRQNNKVVDCAALTPFVMACTRAKPCFISAEIMNPKRLAALLTNKIDSIAFHLSPPYKIIAHQEENVNVFAT